ncbi:MAG: hypothetical protein WEE89_12635 [Gemmatimonadota bacterium]
MKRLDVLELPLLGVALEFISADPRITNALNQVYGHWREWESLRAIRSRPDPLPRIRLALAGTPTCNAPLSPPRVQLTGDRIRMRGTHVRGAADLLRRTGHAVVSPALLDDPERFRADAIDTLALAILTRLDRTPIHASAIANETTMLVFAGPSGMGKSTLAHLGQEAGYEVIADEAVYVQTEPVTRIWGFARSPRPRPFGSVSREKRAPANLVNRVVVPFRERAALCVLHRDGPPEGALEPIALEQAATELRSQLDPGFDQFREVLPDVVRALATDGAWRFYLPAQPLDAVPFFRELLGVPSDRLP